MRREADLPRIRQVTMGFGDHISIAIHYEIRVPRATDLDLSICTTIIFGFGVIANCQDATFEVVLEGLNNPTSVAVQPGTGVVFIADSGAQRIIRVVDGLAEEVITGFA